MRKILAVITLIILIGSVAQPAMARGGNSANAKLCQKGGWELLQRTDGTTFSNQGACVSYSARGGDLVPIAPIRTPRIYTEQYTITDAHGGCDLNLYVEGLSPNTAYWLQATWSGGSFTLQEVTDANGAESSGWAIGSLNPSFAYYADAGLTQLVVATTEAFQCAPVGEM